MARRREKDVKIWLMTRYRPKKRDRERYEDEWEECTRAMGFLKCKTPLYPSKCKNRAKAHTRFGVMCKFHYVNLPRCSKSGCENMAVLDDAINRDMLCREHLFDYEDDRPTVSPWRTRSNIVGEFDA